MLEKARALVGIKRIPAGQCFNHAIAEEYIQHQFIEIMHPGGGVVIYSL